MARKNPKKNKKKRFIEAYIRKMGNISQACLEVGIGRRTFYNWLEDPDFKKEFDSAVEEHNDRVYSRILKKALEEDNDMLKFWAKTQMKSRGFTEKQELEHSTPKDKKLELEIVYPNNEQDKNQSDNGQPSGEST